MAPTRLRGWTPTRQKALTLATVVGLAYWLFGNLYEAVVLSPNWVVDSPAQLTRLNEFFVVTSPTLYFVPLALAALALVFVITRMIGPGYREHLADATALAWWWNGLNLVRIALTAGTAALLFSAFRTL